MMREHAEITLSDARRRRWTAALGAQLNQWVDAALLETASETACEALEQRFFTVKEGLMPSLLR